LTENIDMVYFTNKTKKKARQNLALELDTI